MSNRMTIKHLYMIQSYVAERDKINILDLHLPDSIEVLFSPSEPSTTQIDESEFFSAEEVRAFRLKFYPPVDETKKVDVSHKFMQPQLIPTPDTPPIGKTVKATKLTTSQIATLVKLDVDLDKIDVTEEYVGGSRPQHQRVWVSAEHVTYVLSRRGKVLATS